MPRLLRLLLAFALWGVAYYALARASHLLALTRFGFAALWLPSGIVLVRVMAGSGRLGGGECLAFLAGLAASNLQAGIDGLSSVLFPLFNLLDAGLFGLGYRRLVPARERLHSPRTVAGLLGLIALSAVASGSIAAAYLTLAGKSDSFLAASLFWFVAVWLAQLLCLPLAIARLGEGRGAPWRWPGVRCLATLAGVPIATYALAVHIPAPYAIVAFGLVICALFLPVMCAATATTLAYVAMLAGMAEAPAWAAAGPEVVHFNALSGSFTLLAPLFTALLTGERERRESALRMSESRFRDMMQYSAVGMATTSPAGICLAVNPALCTMTGYPEAELVGRDLGRLTHPDDLEATLDFSRYMLDNEIQSFHQEKRYLRRDGSVFWAELSVSCVRNTNGTVRYFIRQVVDIDDRKRAEAALEYQRRHLANLVEHRTRELRSAKEEAERANRAKSRFLAAASHDLRQPVQALLLMGSLLERQLQGHPAAEILDRQRGAQMALKMQLESLLQVASLDSGAVAANPQPLALGELMERLAGEYGPRAKAKGLRLTQVPTRAWTVSDPLLLERILRNLLENALRYTHSGGIVVGCRRTPDGLRLCVVDTGIGIPPDQQTLIFEEFYQVDNPERSQDKGLGLGLAIVSHLARLLGHRVEVASVQGRGSGFSLALPSHPRPAVEQG